MDCGILDASLSCGIGVDLKPVFCSLGMDAGGWVPVSELLDSLMSIPTETAIYEVVRDCPKVPRHPAALLAGITRLHCGVAYRTTQRDYIYSDSAP